MKEQLNAIYEKAVDSIKNAEQMKDIDELKALKVNLCIECGCCAYACPAKRQLVVVNKLSKRLIAPKK